MSETYLTSEEADALGDVLERAQTRITELEKELKAEKSRADTAVRKAQRAKLPEGVWVADGPDDGFILVLHRMDRSTRERLAKSLAPYVAASSSPTFSRVADGSAATVQIGRDGMIKHSSKVTKSDDDFANRIVQKSLRAPVVFG